MSEAAQPEVTQIVVVGADDDGETSTLQVGAEQWAEGDPLPHLSESFDDPMAKLTQELWKDLLTRSARSAPDVDELTSTLLYFIGRDLYFSHGVPADVAEAGIKKYAEWLYAEYHDAVPE